jgi:hypothetical protein
MDPLPVLLKYVILWQEGREGKKINECYSETKKTPELGNVAWRPEEGHLAPEVQTANGGTSCTPHFCNLL